MTACVNLGFKEENIILSGHQMSNQEVLECDIYYCGEGNTFEEIKDFDKNNVGMTDFSGLGLFDGIIYNQNFYIKVLRKLFCQ